MTTLNRLFFAIPARHKLLIVDGCRSGAMLEGGGRFDGATDPMSVLTKPCSVIWSSSQAGANAMSEQGGTLFHNRLIEALGERGDESALKEVDAL